VCLLIDHMCISVYCIRRLLKVLLSAPLLPNCSFTLVTLLLFANVAACARVSFSSVCSLSNVVTSRLKSQRKM